MYFAYRDLTVMSPLLNLWCRIGLGGSCDGVVSSPRGVFESVFDGVLEGIACSVRVVFHVVT